MSFYILVVFWSKQIKQAGELQPDSEYRENIIEKLYLQKL